MSFENDINDKIKNESALPERLDYPTLRYFWQTNPLVTRKSEDTIPKFLRKIDVLNNFSQREMKIFCNYLHHRKFTSGETIFKQCDLGVGFYFIYKGYVDIEVGNHNVESKKSPLGLTLEKYDYFGELALLQEVSTRNASAISRNGCELIGILKPDVEDLIYNYPLIAAKLLQSVSRIVANRLFNLTSEVKELRYKLEVLERESSDF